MDREQPDTCVGDLGGPLVRRHHHTGLVWIWLCSGLWWVLGLFEIVGVRTIPLMCGPYGGNFPEIWTDVSRYQGWIQEMVDQ